MRCECISDRESLYGGGAPGRGGSALEAAVGRMDIDEDQDLRRSQERMR